jgi:hypothetical protein
MLENQKITSPRAAVLSVHKVGKRKVYEQYGFKLKSTKWKSIFVPLNKYNKDRKKI